MAVSPGRSGGARRGHSGCSARRSNPRGRPRSASAPERCARSRPVRRRCRARRRPAGSSRANQRRSRAFRPPWIDDSRQRQGHLTLARRLRYTFGYMTAAILFDFNGVIIDDEPQHCEALIATLGEDGYALDRDTYYREYLGFDDRECFRFTFERMGRPADEPALLQAIERKNAYYERAIRGSMRLVPG